MFTKLKAAAAAIAVGAPLMLGAAVLVPSAAHASTVRMSDDTWDGAVCSMPNGCDVQTWDQPGFGNVLNANGSDGTSASTYTLTYEGTYYCLQDTGTGGYVAAYSSAGNALEPDAGACGTNEEWSLACIGSTGTETLEVKAGPLAGKYVTYYSDTDADLVATASSSTADAFAMTGECGL